MIMTEQRYRVMGEQSSVLFKHLENAVVKVLEISDMSKNVYHNE